MMKQMIAIIMALMTFSVGHAQTEKVDSVKDNLQSSISNLQSFIGYLSYDSALVSMPQYALVQAKMKKMQEAYEQELRRVEQEFNEKYEAFLDGQRDFPRTILLKRQNELQELLQRNIDFKQQGKADLQQAEQEAMAPLYEQLNQAIANIAREQRLALIVNTDANACPFISPEVSVDVLPLVIKRLQR